MAVFDGGGFGGELAFVEVGDVVVGTVEQVEAFEGDLPVFAAVADAGVHLQRIAAADVGVVFGERSRAEVTGAKRAEEAFLASEREARVQRIRDAAGQHE